MYVYICFDVEDPINIDTDDVALDIAQILADEGIICSMLVVAEKARLWEKRGRRDVISAVGLHDVGMHTNLHSYHPNVAEYLEDKDWAGGVAEFIKREQDGVVDLERIFGQFPSSWATSGYSWGPQIAAAARKMGIPSHVYSFVKSGQTGASWFAGQLCYDDSTWLDGVEDAYCDDAVFEKSLSKLLEEVKQRQKQGLVCMGIRAAHPTRFRYFDYWDEINFKDGMTTPPEKWLAGQRRSDEGYKIGMRNLHRMTMAVRDLPGVQILPFRALNQKFALENQTIPWDRIPEIAQAVIRDGSLSVDDPLASPAQKLDLLSRALLKIVGKNKPKYLPLRTVLGPTSFSPVLDDTVITNLEVGIAFARDAAEYIDRTGHLPSSLIVNGITIGPGALLRGIASTLVYTMNSSLPDEVKWLPGPEKPAIAEEISTPFVELASGWVPHKRDLRTDLLALHTQLQCWTLKPATGCS